MTLEQAILLLEVGVQWHKLTVDSQRTYARLATPFEEVYVTDHLMDFPGGLHRYQTSVRPLVPGTAWQALPRCQTFTELAAMLLERNLIPTGVAR